MKQTSPLLLGLCLFFALTTLGAIGYIALGSGSDDAISAARVAVVDLDAVAQKLGRIDVMNEKLKSQGTNYDGQLKQIQAKLQEQVTAKEQELEQLGPQATDEQKKQLIGMLQLANGKLNEAKRQALAAVQQQKAVLIQKFREEAIAVAEEVAKTKGFDMVIAKNPTVLLSYDPSHDITDAVIEAMPAAEPVVAAQAEEVATAAEQPAPQQVAQTGENSYR